MAHLACRWGGGGPRYGLAIDEGRELAVQLARTVIGDSQRTGSDVIRYAGAPPERVRNVYYGIDTGRFVLAAAEEAEPLRAVFVGALDDGRKGLETLIEAWDKLERTRDWDVELLVVGTGRTLERWRSRTRSRRVRFLGFRLDVPEILRACAVLVAPTRYEPYGQAIHEAICSGIPAIVSRCAGIAERYPENLTELLIDSPSDSDELVRRLEMWRSRSREIRKQARRFALVLRQRSWDDMAAEIVGIVNSDPTPQLRTTHSRMSRIDQWNGIDATRMMLTRRREKGGVGFF